MIVCWMKKAEVMKARKKMPSVGQVLQSFTWMG